VKIHKITLDNFRVFKGEHSFTCTTDPQRNVTLIYGNNGFGKTTLLNSVMWALFDKTTPKLKEPKLLINFSAANDGVRKASVTVDFEQDGQRYVAKREVTEGINSTEFKILKDEGSGNLVSLPNPDIFIRTILPSEMAKHFLFDGEAAETFADQKNRAGMKEAVKQMLGSTLANTLLEDLKEIRNRVRRELGQIPDQDRLADITDKLTLLEEQIILILGQIEDKETRRHLLRVEIESIDGLLRDSESVREIQEHRDDKQRTLDQAKGLYDEAIRLKISSIGQDGTSIVASKWAQRVSESIQLEVQKGRIPSPYQETLINDLLESGLCLCGTDLNSNPNAREKVSSRLADASNPKLESRLIAARSRLSSVVSVASSVRAGLLSNLRREAQQLEEIGRLERELLEISERLAGVDSSEIANLEASRNVAVTEISSIDQAIGQLRLRLRALQDEKSENEILVRDLARRNSEASKAMQRIRLIDKTEEFLKTQLQVYEAEGRQWIEESVNRILSDTCHRNYHCEISSDFSIDLKYESGRSAPRSTGEDIVVSLAFISSLIQFSRSRLGDDRFILQPGTIAPLILDAPFGQLDAKYKRDVAAMIPIMAEQVLLFVSEEQAGRIEDEVLTNSIGRKYTLVPDDLNSTTDGAVMRMVAQN